MGQGHSVSAQFLICAVGALSAPNKPDIPGIHNFKAESLHTGDWPQEHTSFEGKRVGLMVSDFPNHFMIHGPGTPDLLYLMPLGAELKTQWIANCVHHLRGEEMGAVEPTP